MNIDESDNALDIDLVRSVAPYFRLKDRRAKEIVQKVATAVCGWSEVASSLGIARSEQSEMADAFTSQRKANAK